MTSPDRYLNALAALNLPAEWQVEVAIRPRRRCAALEVKPGGDVGILVPPGTDPDELARFVGSRRRWLAAQVDTATRLAPDHAVKQLVDREEFTLLGRRYRLCLVNTTLAAVEQLSAARPTVCCTSADSDHSRSDEPSSRYTGRPGWRGCAGKVGSTNWPAVSRG